MTQPATSIETAVEVSFPSEEYGWLAENPCACGGDWELVRQSLIKKERTKAGLRMTDRLEVCCDLCGRGARFYFVVQYEGGQ